MIPLLIVGSIACLLGYAYSPFPRWSTYFQLWKNVVLNYTVEVPLSVRVQQAQLLLKYGLSAPFYTFLWYLDELLYPNYKKQKIEPVFIIGSPRSGTTLLHRTLAQDEETFFAIRHFEWRYPFVIVQKLIKLFYLEDYIKKTNYWPATKIGNEASKMHANTLYDWEEDGILFDECFLHHLFVITKFPYPNLMSLLGDLPPQGQNHLLAIHQKVIQKIMYIRGENKIYLSKDVICHTKLNILIKMYPHAKFIICLRPSREFINSFLALIRASTMAKTGIDIFTARGLKSVHERRLRDDCLKLLDFKHQEELYVLYNKFIKDIRGTVENIYMNFGINMPERYIQHLEQLQASQKERKKNYTYEYEEFVGFEALDNFINSII
ncbi:11687_t:CDS:1 [Acaulospora morrowiae]|uniref:11687_t:CDS:1 n=1 Tax=Acaulospora morrowiae TaxID=94023 RepID=A0A9N9D208_9GLOM|nr:11687_t:CDS:1 [Acaulospora morrowiae]